MRKLFLLGSALAVAAPLFGPERRAGARRRPRRATSRSPSTTTTARWSRTSACSIFRPAAAARSSATSRRRSEPETVTLNGRGIGIVEQNFDFDLLSPAALMQKAVGQTVTLVRTNPATGAETRERARILAANGGVVMQIGDRIEVLRDDGLPARVIFDRVPRDAARRARPCR